MSTDLMDSRISKLNSLCKDYISVLTRQRAELEDISKTLIHSREKSREKPDDDAYKIASDKLLALQTNYNRLQPAINQIIRAASQTVEHEIPTHDYVDGLELSVRLAELEANMQQTGMLITNLLRYAH